MAEGPSRNASHLRPLRLLVFFPSYAGNGGYSSLSTRVFRWWSQTRAKIEADPRIEYAAEVEIGDTPITMTRNLAVKLAQDNGFDLLMMIDSDMDPDLYVGRLPEAKPFWDTAIDFVWERRKKGLPTVIFAPYCSPPPEEIPYVGYWEEISSDTHGAPSLPNDVNGLSLKLFNRREAAEKTGIEAVAVGPTGAILYTLDAFDCRAPRDEHKPYYYYEYADRQETKKITTEDMANTRDISLGAWIRGIGDVMFCAWDCWWGHLKNKSVGKPFKISNGRAAEKIHLALEREEEEKFAALKTKHPEWFADPPAAAPEPPAAEPDDPPLANEYAGKHGAVAIGDPRWGAKELKGLEATLHHVVKTRMNEGSILVCYDRDLAASRLAMSHVLRGEQFAGDLFLYWHAGDPAMPAERASAEDNRAELERESAFGPGIVRGLHRDVRPEEIDYDKNPGAIHLVIDLREKIAAPITRHAYAYYALSKPEWSDNWYRLSESHGKAATWIHEDFLPASEEASPDERREPICG